jgi:hypothetical protein
MTEQTIEANLANLRFQVNAWIRSPGKEAQTARVHLRSDKPAKETAEEIKYMFEQAIESKTVERLTSTLDDVVINLASQSLNLIDWLEIVRMYREPEYNFKTDRQVMDAFGVK